MGGSTKQATSVNTTTPWEKQVPYYEAGFKAADELWKKPGPDYYPGNTVAPFSAYQTEAQGLGAARARSGNSVVNNAQGYANDVLGGRYLNSDPYQDSVFQNIRSHVQPAVASQFANSGRYGSGLHADTSTRALTEAYAPYASQQYQQGLDRMDNMAGMSPQFAQQDFQNIEALNSIGAQQQQLGQREIDDAATRYAYYQDQPYNKLAQYMGLIGGSLGGTTTSQTPYYQPSTFSQIAGAGLGLAGTIGGLLSDVRAKENIRAVGKLDNGIPIYSYRYKGGAVTHIGVLAQEAELTRPDAVMTAPDGVKYVNYDRVTR